MFLSEPETRCCYRLDIEIKQGDKNQNNGQDKVVNNDEKIEKLQAVKKVKRKIDGSKSEEAPHNPPGSPWPVKALDIKQQ
ncbi:MAG: hypothetical protein WCK92_05070 [Bacteroidota bacterium]